MEVEQRVIIKFLRFKGMKLRDIHHELTLAFGGEAYTLASVKHWIHELETGRIILTDDTRSGRPSIDHIHVLILKQLSETPFPLVRSLSEDLEIPKTTVWRRLTESLQLKSRHFKCVSYTLTEELRQKRVDEASNLLGRWMHNSRLDFATL
jgi:transposase